MHILVGIVGVVFALFTTQLNWEYALHPEEYEAQFGAAPRVLTVSQGGTGAASFTEGECLVGHGTGPLTSQACGGSSGFSTTSADYWKTERNFFSTSSADHWETLQAPRGGFAWPFPNNATTTALIFAASTTIGDGTAGNGLTINGNATSTGDGFFLGGDLYVAKEANNDLGGNLILSNGFDGGYGSTYSALFLDRFKKSGIAKVTTTSNARGDIRFLQNNEASNGAASLSDTVMIVKAGGAIGIATTSPYAKLSVVGETVASHFTATTTSTNTFPNASITKLVNLTSNGFVKTSGGDGTLSVDTTTYESGLTAGDGLTRTTNDFDCDTASGAAFGCLAAADFTTFNNKVSSTSIDTIGEVETLWGVTNILIENDIDASSELAALVDDETGSGGALVFASGPTLTGVTTLANASTTLFSSSYASSTVYYGAGLANCNTGNMLTWTDGKFGCEDDSTAGGGSFDGTGTAHMLAAFTDSDTLTATGTPQFASFIATSTTATSTIAGSMQFGSTAGDNLLRVNCTRGYPASNSVGGCISVINTLNSAAGIMMYTNHAGSAAAPLFQTRVDNVAFDFPGWRLDYDGANDGLVIAATAAASNAISVSNTGVDHTINATYTGSTADKGALNLTSTNANGSVFQIAGNMTGLGVGKITHNDVGDADASILSLAASNASYAGQGLFIDMASSSNAQKVLNIRADGHEVLTTDAGGTTTVPQLTVNNAMSIFGTYGTAWSAFCSAITGGSGLCDGTDATEAITAGDALTRTGDDIDFDGGATPSGNLGGTWASPTVIDLTCTDCIGTTEIADSYLLNNGDSGTGTYDFSGATMKEHTYSSFAYSTSTAWTGTTTVPLGPAYTAESWSGVKCFTDTGTVNVSFYDGTNRMDMLNASTTVGTFGFSTNNTFTASEKRYVDIGTPASTPTKVSCTVDKIVNN